MLFSPSLLADRVVSFPDRADSFSFHVTDVDFASIDGHSGFFESGTSGSDEGHGIWLSDFDDHPGKAWGWHKHHDDGDTDGDSGNTGSTVSGGASTLAVPEPSVLLLLSAALAAFLLKSLRRATV